MKLIIADDSEILRKHLLDMLADIRGLEIIGEAGDTETAINSVKDLQPDVVLIDIRIPGKGGIHILKKVKEFHKEIITIMFTDYPYPQYREKCEEEGADYFFEKAGETEKMLEVLNDLSIKMGNN